MKKIPVLFPLAVIALAGSAWADTPAKGFIREANPVTLDAGGSEMTFIKAADGRLSFAVTWVAGESRDKISVPEQGFFKRDGWFVYVESPDRIWMFDGIRQLDCVMRGATLNGRYSVTMPGVAGTCPDDVWGALPEPVRSDLREKAKR